MRWFGLDVGRSAAEVAVVERGHRARSLGKIGVAAESLRAFAATLGPDDAVCLEATTNTWPIVDVLAQHAGRVVVSNPLRTRAIADAKTKSAWNGRLLRQQDRGHPRAVEGATYSVRGADHVQRAPFR